MGPPTLFGNKQKANPKSSSSDVIVAVGAVVLLGASIWFFFSSFVDSGGSPNAIAIDLGRSFLPQESTLTNAKIKLKVTMGTRPTCNVLTTTMATDSATREAIAACIGMSPSTFVLKHEDQTVANLSQFVLDNLMSISSTSPLTSPTFPLMAEAVMNGATIVKACPDLNENNAKLVDRDGTMQKQQRDNPDTETNFIIGTATAPKIPRVLIACVGTGRYRHLAVAALMSAVEHFGHDCVPSFHLLTDNLTSVPPILNPTFAPYRPWPESGLSKFEDLLTGLQHEIIKSDYFYFMDGDVLFHENVSLMDVAGDLVGVEHPMYPRDHEGWCHRADGQPMCMFPYDRNPQSQAYIPPHVGKFLHTTVGGRGVVRTYMVSTWWYLQSAFWGGRSVYIYEMLVDLANRVNVDRKANRYSMAVQDERYFNYYMWAQSSNSSKNLRILSHSFLFPYRNEGFGDWVKEKHRPIIYHGTKVPGKQDVGEVDIGTISTNQCLGFFLNPQVGMFGCHHGGGMQGWIVETSDGVPVEWPPPPHTWVRFRQATTNHQWSQCIQGNMKPAEAAAIQTCRNDDDGILWQQDESNRIVNKKSQLCMDVMTKPPHKREPLLLQPCSSDSPFQRFKITTIGSVKCTQKWCKMFE
eukprot:m.248889 g.248889  ORF g.248889 m.248889 type:complete len:636 (+) comp33866_c5_seq1:122-2029(+)